MPRRFVLADEIDKQRENNVVIEAGDEEFVIDAPRLWPDDKVAELEAAFAANDFGAIGSILLGKDPYKKYTAAGGTGALLLSIYREAAGELGESSASSRS